MSRDMDWRLLLPRPLRTLPADLGAVLVLVVLTVAAATIPVIKGTPIRIILGLPYLLFIPGYALVAALFPEAAERSTRMDDNETEIESGIDGIERVALSFGLSIAVVPLIGLLLNFTPWGMRLIPIVAVVSAFTVILTFVASRRRQALNETDRFVVPYERWITDAKAELFAPDSRADAALNVLLVVSILLAAGSTGYAIFVPPPGEQFSELYLLTEDESGDLVADEYPTEFIRGEAKPLHIGIGNHEGREVQYTVVAQLHRVERQNNATVVRERTELHRYTQTVGANSTWSTKTTVSPSMTGDRLRLTYLLYKGSAPENPTIDNAYRENHLWVNVSAPQ
ncbi:DUF1616 domain-containing protein [Halogeometricum borinquense]|nr:DUF1616 domain-containing protein [Halogeometricum borinquense]